MSMVERAQTILRDNDRGGYCVPTARLYPFQWNWDSAFVAMGWSTFDEARAWQEIASLMKGQWDDRMIPHIVFHAPSDDYFPDRMCGASRARPRPPASPSRRCWQPRRGIYGTAGGTVDWPMQPRPRSIRHCCATTAGGRRRVIRNAAAWWQRCILGRRGWTIPPPGTQRWRACPPYRHADPPARHRAGGRCDAPARRGLSAVHPLGRPVPRVGWDPARMLSVSPFRVADVGTNAILLRAERDLLALAGRFGSADECTEVETRIIRLGARSRSAVARRPRSVCQHGPDHARNLPDQHVRRVPAALRGASRERAGVLAATLARWATQVRRLVPSTDPAFAGFEPKRYWRGPVWAVVNWMIADEFAAAGDAATEGRIRTDAVELTEAAGLSDISIPPRITGSAAVISPGPQPSICCGAVPAERRERHRGSGRPLCHGVFVPNLSPAPSRRNPPMTNVNANIASPRLLLSAAARCARSPRSWQIRSVPTAGGQ